VYPFSQQTLTSQCELITEDAACRERKESENSRIREEL
jgi:hypothetical protein